MNAADKEPPGRRRSRQTRRDGAFHLGGFL